MKIFQLLISLSFTIALVVALNMKIGPVPPLGKFLDPFNGFWANARNADEMPKRINLTGLSQEVKVQYDDILIPHIFAVNENDLYLATGYIHASHRLWQMEFQTHAAAGRLSEIAGDITLDLDRSMRRVGMVFGAENFIANIDEESRQILQQYARGVNHYIDQLKYQDYPFEYKLLHYQPEPWTILKSGLLYKYMSDMLNSHEKDMENTNFRALYGEELLNLIYPDVDNYKDPVVEQPDSWPFVPIIKGESAFDNMDHVTQLIPIPGADINNGSNNWAVAPSRTANGHAILCNDMHLGLYMPSLWFYNQLSTEGMNVFGHSLPGVPFVITGFTDSIGWGFTNAQRDLVDWYKVEYENEGRNAYLLDGKYVSVTRKVEEIKIRDKDTFYDTVAYTIFGPVTYDHSFRSKSQKNGYARRWIDHDPSGGLKMFHQMNKAKNFDDYMKALDHYTSPAQNVVFASASGDIALRIQGKYPLNNFEEGKFIKDGSKSANNWRVFIPNEHNAYWKNPDRGFVSSANQHPTDATYPYFVTATSFEAYRNRRINDVLRADSAVTIEDMKHLHYDNFSTKAAESLPYMIELLRGASLNAMEMDIVEHLKTWDYYFDADTKLGVYYDIWFNNLYRCIWDEIKTSRDKEIWLAWPTNYSTINLMKTFPEHPFFDHQDTEIKETAKDLVLMAFREMITKMSELESEKGEITWSNYKSTFIGHQLRIKPLGYHNITSGGRDGDVVNATGTNHGPSQRLIVELDPAGVKAWGHYPGGQSGNPGSRYYDNMVQGWANGDYFELLLLQGPEDRNERIIFSQTLTAR
jgi:penicillin G amidase